MKRKVFTKQEVEMLRSNPFTYAVTSHALSFTKAFKELFWQEYQAGAIPRQILEKYGYPSEVLGNQRIWGIAHTIKMQYYSPEGLHEGTLPKTTPPDSSGLLTNESIQQLQNEVQYLRQEIEFLKKISSIKTIRK